MVRLSHRNLRITPGSTSTVRPQLPVFPSRRRVVPHLSYRHSIPTLCLSRSAWHLVCLSHRNLRITPGSTSTVRPQLPVFSSRRSVVVLSHLSYRHRIPTLCLSRSAWHLVRLSHRNLRITPGSTSTLRPQLPVFSSRRCVVVFSPTFRTATASQRFA